MSKILIIDDEVQIRSLLARMLELEGYEVCQAGDCKAAIKQLEIQSPDVALCDVFLPDGNLKCARFAHLYFLTLNYQFNLHRSFR